MRKRVLIGIGIFLILFSTILFLPSVFKTPVANILRSEINKHVDAKVSFSDADINLWRNFPQFTVSLNNFAIAGMNEFTGDTLIRASNLALVISSWELIFHDGIEIRDLKFSDPEILISVLHDESANYDITKTDSLETGDDVILKIKSWQVENGKFIYDDLSTGVHFESQGVSLQGHIDVNGPVTAFTIASVAEKFTGYYEGKRYISEKTIAFNLDGTYDSDSSVIKFAENAISVNNLDVGFSGSVKFVGEDQEVDLSFKTADADFEDVLSLSQTLFKDFKKMNIAGKMSLEGQFLGILNTDKDLFPAFKMNFIVEDGSIKYRSLPSSVKEINFDLAVYNVDGNLQNTIVDLQYFGMKMGENPIFGSGQIEGFKNGKIHADLMAKLPLSDITSVYPVEGIDLEGDLDFSLKADGSYSGFLTDLASRLNDKKTKMPSFEMALSVRNGGLKYDHLPEAISNMQLEMKATNSNGSPNNTSIDIRKFSAMLGDNPIMGNLRTKGITDPILNGNFNCSLNLAEIKNFYPIDGITLKGVLGIDAKLDGQLSDSLRVFPKVFATVKLDDAFIQSSSYPIPMENTHLIMQAINDTGKVPDTKLIIDTLTYSIENESFMITGALQDLERYVYDLDIKGVLYLDKLQKILNLDLGEMRGEIDIDARTAGNLDDLKAKNYHKLPTTGQLKLKDVFIRNEMVPHGLHIDEGHMFFSNEKLHLDTLHGEIGESSFNLSGHLTNYLAYAMHNNETIKGDLLFESKNFNLNELLSEDVSKKDTVHHDLAVIGLPSNIDFTFDSKIKQLQYKGLLIEDLDGEIVLKQGVLTLNKTEFKAMGASFAVSGDYDPREKRHPKFDFDLGIHELDISKAHDAFVSVQAMAPAAEHTFGIFSLDYKLKGELHQNMYPVFESLSGGGTVRIRDAQINGMKLFHHISGITKKEELMNPKLKDIVMETSMEEGVLYVKPFSMKLAGFDTDIEGKHELSGSMNYIVRIALPPFDIVKIPLHVDGTYDKPKVHLGKGHEDAFKKPTSKTEEQVPVTDPTDPQTQGKADEEE